MLAKEVNDWWAKTWYPAACNCASTWALTIRTSPVFCVWWSSFNVFVSWIQEKFCFPSFAYFQRLFLWFLFERFGLKWSLKEIKWCFKSLAMFRMYRDAGECDLTIAHPRQLHWVFSKSGKWNFLISTRHLLRYLNFASTITMQSSSRKMFTQFPSTLSLAKRFSHKIHALHFSLTIPASFTKFTSFLTAAGATSFFFLGISRI